MGNKKGVTPESRLMEILERHNDVVDRDLAEVGIEISSERESQKGLYEEKDVLYYLIAKLRERIEEKEMKAEEDEK